MVTPSRAREERFLSILREHGVIATLRREEKATTSPPLAGQLRLPDQACRRQSAAFSLNGAEGIGDIEHVAIGNRAR